MVLEGADDWKQLTHKDAAPEYQLLQYNMSVLHLEPLMLMGLCLSCYWVVEINWLTITPSLYGNEYFKSPPPLRINAHIVNLSASFDVTALNAEHSSAILQCLLHFNNSPTLNFTVGVGLVSKFTLKLYTSSSQSCIK